MFNVLLIHERYAQALDRNS